MRRVLQPLLWLLVGLAILFLGVLAANAQTEKFLGWKTVGTPSGQFCSRVLDLASSQLLVSATAVVSDTPMTICAWAKLYDASTAVQQIIASTADNDGNDDRYIHMLEWGHASGTGSTLNTAFGIASRTTSSRHYSSGSTSSATWYAVCGTWTPATSPTTLNLYVNYVSGGATAGGTDNTVFPTVPPTKFMVGARPGSGAGVYKDWWTGKIAHVAVWNRVLGTAALAAYAAGSNPLASTSYDGTAFNSGLVAYYPWWDADENGVGVDDDYSSGGANDLTPVNAPTWDCDDVPTVAAMP